MSHLLLLWFAAASPDGHRLAVLVEASSAAVDVGVGGRRHRLLPGPDRLGCGGGEREQHEDFSGEGCLLSEMSGTFAFHFRQNTNCSVFPASPLSILGAKYIESRCRESSRFQVGGREFEILLKHTDE